MNLSKKRCTQAGFHVSSGVLALVLVFCVGIVFNPGLFLSHSNMQNILRQTVTNALLAFERCGHGGHVRLYNSLAAALFLCAGIGRSRTLWCCRGHDKRISHCKSKIPANDSNLFHAAYDKGAYSGFNQWNHAENKYGQSYYEISGTWDAV